MADELGHIDPMTANPEQTLLGLLKQQQALQQQPLIAQNWGNAAAAPLLGFAAGMRGQQNPLVTQALQERQQQLSSLAQQATIAATLDSMAHRRETERRLRATEARAEAKDAATIQRDNMKIMIDAAEKGMNDENYDRRVGAYRLAQKVPLPDGSFMVPPHLDPRKLALERGKDYQAKRDTALNLIAHGYDPSDTSMYGTEFNPELFPLQEWAQLRDTKGPEAVLALKSGVEKGDTHFKARFIVLKKKGDKRTPDETAEMGAISEALKLNPDGQTTVERLAMDLANEAQQDAAAKGVPFVPKPRSEYIRDATRLLDKSSSQWEWMLEQSKMAGKGPGTPGHQSFMVGLSNTLNENRGYSGMFGGRQAMQDTPLSPKDASEIYMRGHGGRPMPIPLGTTPREAKMMGARQIDDVDKRAYYELDASLVQISNLEAITNQIITAQTPGEAIIQRGKLGVGSLTGYDQNAKLYTKAKEGFMDAIGRATAGFRNQITDRDLARLSGAFPDFGDTVAIKDAKWIIIRGIAGTMQRAAEAKMWGESTAEESKKLKDSFQKQLETLERIGAIGRSGNTNDAASKKFGVK